MKQYIETSESFDLKCNLLFMHTKKLTCVLYKSNIDFHFTFSITNSFPFGNLFFLVTNRFPFDNFICLCLRDRIQKYLLKVNIIFCIHYKMCTEHLLLLYDLSLHS